MEKSIWNDKTSVQNEIFVIKRQELFQKLLKSRRKTEIRDSDENSSSIKTGVIFHIYDHCAIPFNCIKNS